MSTGLIEPETNRLRSSLHAKDRRTLGLWSVVVFVSYLLAAEAAFLIGTLSDNIFAPFWPPNIVLLIALLSDSQRLRLVSLAAAAPAHIIAELQVGMSFDTIVVAFATNVAVAAGGAAAVKKLLGSPPWFAEFKRAGLYVAVVGLAIPAVVALGGAFVPILSGGVRELYWSFWLQWFASNAIGNLTLGPIALILFSGGLSAIWPAERSRRLEAGLCFGFLVITSAIVVTVQPTHYNLVFLPAILYAPVLIILWAAIRFGAKGAALAIPTAAIVLIASMLESHGILASASAETNVFAIQLFLASVAVPALLLGASIDQIRSAELRHQRDEERMAFVASTANIGLWSYDPAKDLFWTTDHCRKLMGIPLFVDVSRDAFFAEVHPDDLPHIAGLLSPDETKPKPLLFEFRVKATNDQVRWLIGKASPGQDEAGNSIVNGAVSDITARKIAEQDADQQRRELAHLMRVAQVGELSGGLAHELTQPLTAILANAQAARMMLSGQRGVSEKLRDIVDDIISEDHRAGEVVKRIRGYLKNDPDTFDNVDVNEVVNTTLHLLHSELIGRRVRLATNLEDRLPAIAGDVVQLQQVLLNLVMNAIDSVNTMTITRRHISIKTRILASDEIELMVMDRGIGLSRSEEERAFEPFFTTKERGLGLGLSICMTIVKRHGGALTLHNNPEGGAIAIVRLPFGPETGGRE